VTVGGVTYHRRLEAMVTDSSQTNNFVPSGPRQPASTLHARVNDIEPQPHTTQERSGPSLAESKSCARLLHAVSCESYGRLRTLIRLITHADADSRSSLLSSTPSVPKCLSLENRVSLTNTLPGRPTKRDRVVLCKCQIMRQFSVPRESDSYRRLRRSQNALNMRHN
jgi:hypothetical protein